MFYKIKEVDYEKCDGCEKCVQVCHANCFDMVYSNEKVVAHFINPQDCNACGDCIAACHVNGSAIILVSTKKEKEGYVFSIDKTKCVACGKCINLCPEKNIEITEEKGRIFAKVIDSKKCAADGHCSFSCPVDDKIYNKKKEIILKKQV